MNQQLIKIEFSKDQIELIKSQIARDCNDNELQLFLYQCKRTGLDPLTRQIYAIKRSSRMTIQTSIDGFRVIAERSNSYAGQDAPIWTYNPDGTILNCTVTVYRFRGDIRYPAGVGVAFFNEYYPNPVNLQKTLAHTMIAKVAEALALRKAFPQDLSGLYTADEMNQADIQPAQPVADTKMITDGQCLTILELVETAEIDYEAKEKIKYEVSYKMISEYEASRYINRLNNLQRKDNIDSGGNYSQTDIKNKLKNI